MDRGLLHRPRGLGTGHGARVPKTQTIPFVAWGLQDAPTSGWTQQAISGLVVEALGIGD